jgi:hypothetical protein
MEATVKNPGRNCLAGGITEADLLTAIEKSGYPLQTRTAKALGENFGLYEEWSYKDRDTNTLRALDIYARRALFDYNAPQPRTTPHLSLLIECKQSEMPFIFFETQHPARLTNFPTITGLKDQDIQLTTNEDLSTYSISILTALGLAEHDFIKRPPFASTFSKCGRRGKTVELSGEEAYNGVIMPLIKAALHLENTSFPKPTYQYFEANLCLPVAVLSAPMVLARATEPQPIADMCPWVRVIRHEYSDNTNSYSKSRFWAIDVVHEDYLKTYINDHALPFALAFAQKVLQHGDELALCKGHTEHFKDSFFRDGVKDLKPRSSSTSKRALAAARRLVESLESKGKPSES